MKTRNKRFQQGGQKSNSAIEEIDPLDDQFLVEDYSTFNSPEQLARMSENRRVNTSLGNYDQEGQVVNQNVITVPNQQPIQFFNPYAGVDLESGAQYLGESIGSGNTAGTVLGAAKVGLSLGRNILGGMGRGNVRNESMRNYYDNQRKSMTGSETYKSFQQGGQQSFNVFGHNLDFRNDIKTNDFGSSFYDYPQQFQDGGQPQDPLQAISQMIQQGADPEQIMQDMVSSGVPQEEAMQAIQQAMSGGGDPQQQQQPAGGEDMQQQVMEFIQQALSQGVQPEQILQELVNGGVPQEQAIQMIESLIGSQQQAPPQQEQALPQQEQAPQPQMQRGGEFLSQLRGKRIVDYTYNDKTGNYDIQYE